MNPVYITTYRIALWLQAAFAALGLACKIVQQNFAGPVWPVEDVPSETPADMKAPYMLQFSVDTNGAALCNVGGFMNQIKLYGAKEALMRWFEYTGSRLYGGGKTFNEWLMTTGPIQKAADQTIDEIF